jgi:hypothetical protein
VGNVTNVNTTLAGGQTDNQVFCYDEQDRLTWAGSTGTPPSSCGQTLSPGSLSAAYYTQSFSYDTYDRLTSGPLGAYTYGDTNHLHAATAAGSGPTYTASYDGAGNMVCRAPNPAVGSCALGQNTGQQLTYDAEGRLSHWQNVPGGSPDSQASFRYDGEGERVAQQSTTSGGSIRGDAVREGKDYIAAPLSGSRRVSVVGEPPRMRKPRRGVTRRRSVCGVASVSAESESVPEGRGGAR